jgi:zinc transport system substrate-binding protein
VRAVISRIVLVIFMVSALAGCGSTSASPGKKAVVAAFYPLAYAAERIGGRSIDVENLTPVGAEPHDIELTPRTVARIVDADVVLFLGDGFQPAVADAAEQTHGRAVDLLDGLPLRPGDAHVWLDPVLFTRVVQRIGAALGLTPRPLVADLHRLDRQYRIGLRHCARRAFVTSHAAFGYLAGRYGLRQVAITGITPEAEPSPQQLARAVKEVRRTGSTTVFFERLVSPRVAETVARETGARTAVLDPIEGLTDEEQQQGQTYFTLMQHNLLELRDALGCR